MTRYLLAATALATGLAAMASPAVARDRSAYFGLEVGALYVKDTDIDLSDDEVFDDDFSIDHKMGVDGDMIAGYDFGMFRGEAELGYKRSEHDEYSDDSGAFDGDGRSSVYSLMANGMVDVGQDEGVSFYAGGGLGWAQVTHVLEDNDVGALKLRDRGFAWQAIAGVRAVVSQYFDIGLKYRYFDAGNVSDNDEGIDLDADYKSHSLLFSLIHNFNSPLPPPPPEPVVVAPPPPPPPPATQTCPDGSVILATDVCPMPPAPPPPPPPEPERG